jgi:hypothetical protein
MLEHLSEEDAEKWEAELDKPLRGQSDRSLAEQEMEQLKHL